MVSPFADSEINFSAATSSGHWVALSGIGLGTTYQITYLTDEPGTYDLEITLLLRQFSRALSVFEPDSEVSRFNWAGRLRFESPYVYPVLRASAEVFALTDGAFDPTVGALVEAYGFGRTGRRIDPSGQFDTEHSVVGFEYVQFDQEQVWRTHPDVRLNFNAIAKGYAVDMVGQFLEGRGVGRYLVEIGGEVRGRGLNPQGEPWRIGITDPRAEGQLSTVIPLTNRALATSGNYRNRYEQDGLEYTHLMNPKTGQMSQSDLLSVTVVADDCMTADALATAFVIMGTQKTRPFLLQHPQWQAYLIPHSDFAV